MIGILPVHKPIGMSSHDAVYAVRRVINPKGTPKSERIKVGHAGTLDPFASGVLLITIGRATKLESFIHTHVKTYEAVIQLGQSTTTDDPEGDILETAPIPNLSETIEQDLQATFTGTIQQRPPIFSALKQGGEALYKKARRGEQIDVPLRDTFIQSLDILEITKNTLRIRTTVGSGTYIRSLGRDIGEFLGTKAHLTELTRTSIGPWPQQGCVNLDDLSLEIINTHNRFSAEHLGIEAVEISHADQVELQFGRSISNSSNTNTPGAQYLAIHAEQPVAIVQYEPNATFAPKIVLDSCQGKKCVIDSSSQPDSHAN